MIGMYDRDRDNNKIFSVAGNKIGDVCEGDTDSDGVLDKDDHCPRNPNIQGTDLRPYTVVDLLPGVNQSDWRFSHNGAEVRQVADLDHPVMLIGECISASDWLGCCVPVSLIGQFMLDHLIGQVVYQAI